MKKLNIYLIQVLLLIAFMLFNIFVFNITNTYVFFGVLILGILILFFYSGYEQNNYRNKKDVLYKLVVNIIIYLLITYIAGLFVGFVRNAYNLSFKGIIFNSFPFLIIIIAREFYRYLYFTKARKKFVYIIIGIVFFVLLDVNMSIHLYDVKTTLGLIKMICLVIFSSISKNLFLTYVTMNVGYGNTIFYCCVMELKKFILPIFPDFGDYLGTIIDVLFPAYLTYSIYKGFNSLSLRRVGASKRFKGSIFVNIAIFLFSSITIALVSGYFKYFALTIGSGSMTSNINKGDVVIVKKIATKDLEKELKIGHVLVYNNDDRIIVHRLVEIKKIAGKTFYITKGDNNADRDSYLIKPDEVIGIVAMKIRFIGYPTVYLNERIVKES